MNSILLDHALSQTNETALLQSLLDKILEKHHPQQAPFTIRWGIPGATLVKRTIAPPEHLPDAEQQAQLNRCKGLLVLGRWAQAATLLKPLADAGHAEAQCLITHALRRTGGDWEAYAQRYAARAQHIRLVPASSHDRERRDIVLHSYLLHRKAPQFVLTYLIYHECTKSLFPATGDGALPEAFLVAERNAPNREKAIGWLSRHGFPVIQFER